MINKYALFAAVQWQFNGGMNDFRGLCETMEQAKQRFDELRKSEQLDWAHVVHIAAADDDFRRFMSMKLVTVFGEYASDAQEVVQEWRDVPPKNFPDA